MTEERAEGSGEASLLGQTSGAEFREGICELHGLFLMIPSDRKAVRTACFPLSIPAHPYCTQLRDGQG